MVKSKPFGKTDAVRIVHKGTPVGRVIHVTVPDEFLKPGEKRHVTGDSINGLVTELCARFGGRMPNQQSTA